MRSYAISVSTAFSRSNGSSIRNEFRDEPRFATPTEAGIAAERRVLDVVRACGHVKRARRATEAEDREGIDIVATLKCGHVVRLQVKAGGSRKPADHYTGLGVVLIEQAIGLPLAKLESRVLKVLVCTTCPAPPKRPSRMLHSWIPAHRGWRCARSGCRVRSATIDDLLTCKQPRLSGERLVASENRKILGLPKKGKR
jgi:hypothetical protein